MNEIKKLREKYNMYLSKRDYTKAVEVMKKINSLSQIRRTAGSRRKKPI